MLSSKWRASQREAQPCSVIGKSGLAPSWGPEVSERLKAAKISEFS